MPLNPDLGIWNDNANTWDSAMGPTGNAFYKYLVRPSCMKLLGINPQEEVSRPLNILELSCGNGIFATYLASLSPKYRILATDFSEAMLEKAKPRWEEGGLGEQIEHMVVDVTKESNLRAVVQKMKETHAQGWKGFDKVVCNMALMDINEIETLARELPNLLAQGGSFIATICHPSFNAASGTKRIVTIEDDNDRGTVAYSIQTTNYLEIGQTLGEAIPGQPKLQHYYHRPLHVLLRTFFRHGLVMDGLEEPSFKEMPIDEKAKVEGRSWLNYEKIPPVFAFRLRKIGK